MAIVTREICSFDGGKFSLSVTFDDVTLIAVSAQIINQSGKAVHSQVSDGTHNWNVTIPPGNQSFAAPPNLRIDMSVIGTLSTYHRYPDT